MWDCFLAQAISKLKFTVSYDHPVLKFYSSKLSADTLGVVSLVSITSLLKQVSNATNMMSAVFKHIHLVGNQNELICTWYPSAPACYAFCYKMYFVKIKTITKAFIIKNFRNILGIAIWECTYLSILWYTRCPQKRPSLPLD